MKPFSICAHRRDYEIRPIPHADAANLIKRAHYAKGSSHTSVYSHGLFRADILVGAAMWLPPTKNCAMTIHEDWRRVLSLSRLAILDAEPKMAESILIGGSIRMIRKEGKWAALVTFADESQGHTGTIYRATNWVYRGITKATPRWEDPDGRQVSPLATKTRTRAQMEALGYRLVGHYRKHKFAMALRGSLLPEMAATLPRDL